MVDDDDCAEAVGIAALREKTTAVATTVQRDMVLME
jgi:hypothetical protein